MAGQSMSHPEYAVLGETTMTSSKISTLHGPALSPHEPQLVVTWISAWAPV
jgi:hypothetical protein